MVGPGRVFVVLLLVVSTGCVGLSGQSLSERVSQYTGDPDNPYRDDELVVAVDTDESERTFTPHVRDALDFWERNDERYLNYSVNFTLASNATDPDVRVTFRPELDRCGRVKKAAGCAPQITHPAQTADTVDVQLLDNLSTNSTVRVLEHEFGHALGLGHNDAPRGLMRTHSVLTTLPATNATDRAFAWNDATLSVFVDTENAPGAPGAVREQVTQAIGYYDRGAEGSVPKNVSFEFVDDPRTADVVVRFADSARCGFGSGSCGSVSGVDPDGDGALERYTRVDILLTDLDTDAVGWHVARWLALGFGIEEESAYPQVLREKTSYEDRRSEWWR